MFYAEEGLQPEIRDDQYKNGIMANRVGLLRQARP